MRLSTVRKKVRSVALAAVATLAFGVSGGELKAETLADAMVGAYKHSGLLEKNRALLRAADEDVAVAVSALRPIVSWSAGLDYTYARSSSLFTTRNEKVESSIGISASLLLYDAGRSKMGVDVAKETVLATRQNLVSVEQRVLLTAMNAYLDVKSASEGVRLRQSNLRVIGEELRAARDRFEVGEVTRTDVSLAEARLAAARAQLASSRGELARAVEAYRAAVGRKPGNLRTPSAVKMPASSLDGAKSIAQRTHPDLKSVQHQITAAEIGILVAQAAMKPSLSLSGRYGLTETFNSNNSGVAGSIGLEATAPIYQGGRLSALERKARAQRDSVRGDLHIARHSIAQNVGNAWAQVEVARSSAIANRQQVRAAELAFRGVREEATLGARTTLDVLDAEQSLLDARTALLTAQYDEIRAGYTLLASMGLLTVDQLNLDVPRYDPAAYYNLVKTAPAKQTKQGKQLDRVLKKLGKN